MAVFDMEHLLLRMKKGLRAGRPELRIEPGPRVCHMPACVVNESARRTCWDAVFDATPLCFARSPRHHGKAIGAPYHRAQQPHPAPRNNP